MVVRREDVLAAMSEERRKRIRKRGEELYKIWKEEENREIYDAHGVSDEEIEMMDYEE